MFADKVFKIQKLLLLSVKNITFVKETRLISEK